MHTLSVFQSVERPGLAEHWREDTVQNSPDRNDAETRGMDGRQQELLSRHPQYEDDNSEDKLYLGSGRKKPSLESL